MKQRKLMIRIVALLMALLMGVGVFAGVYSIFARAADETTLAAVAATGSQQSASWPIYVAIAAVLLVIVCIVIPKMTKKK